LKIGKKVASFTSQVCRSIETSSTAQQCSLEILTNTETR